MKRSGGVRSPGTGIDGQSDLAALQLEALPPAMLVALAGAYGILGYVGLVASTVDVGATLVATGLLASVLTAVWIGGSKTRLAAVVFVAGLMGAIALAVYLRPSFGVATLFAPVVVLAGLLLGGRLSVPVAVVAAVDTWASLGSAVGTVPLDTVLLIVAILLGLPLSWLLTRPANLALSWAWHSYEQALAVTEELRRRQAELGRLSKSLEETCYRLEEANKALDVARRSAEEARRLKAQFAASVSHELRTPLNLIIGFSEMMVLAPGTYRGEVLPDRYRGDVEAIYRNACHLSDLVDDVLELSQVDTNRVGLHKELTALGEVVDEAVATVASMFRDKQLSLVTNIPKDLPLLTLDRMRIRQVLINLLNNAARFTDEGGVRVSAEADAREVVVAVTDTGVGIPAAELPLVFEEFHQVRGAGHGFRGGSGLGLTITKRFVELHGGNIWVESQPSVSTTFRFSLPISGNVIALPPPPNWSVLLQPYDEVDCVKPILVVGDDPEATRILQRHLDGYRVVPVASVREARDEVSRGEASAVIAISTSAEVEWQRTCQIDGSQTQVPLLTCTWRTSRSLRDELGVAAYLIKPISRALLIAVLHRLGQGVRDLLIVDDDPEMLRLLEQMIPGADDAAVGSGPPYRAQLVSDGTAALACMRERCPDAVILDLLMPGVDGYAVLREMRRDDALRAVPVVVVTAKGLEDDVITANAVTVSRGAGLSVAETIHCLKASLDGVVKPVPRSSAPEPRAELTAGPAS